jgi:taurine--2-oxoglutarate transaminase
MDQDDVNTCMAHNFWTWSAQKHVLPIPIERAEGVYFWDSNGKRYLDFNSMVMCCNVGHGQKHIQQAMIQQIESLPFAGPHTVSKPRAQLCRKLTEILPKGLDKFLFTLGGADANENAVKLARGYTGKFKILTQYRSYHGATFGALALTGDPRRTTWEPGLMPGVVHFSGPYAYRSSLHSGNLEISEERLCRDYLHHLESVIQFEGPDTIAAIMIESVTGTNGILIPPQGYMQGVRELCDRFEICLILDEVMSGFGRTGKWFACQHWGVTPDILTMAKGLTGAYAPLGAVAMQEKIAAAYDEKVYQGGLTFNGHPVSLAAAIATIELMQEEKIVDHAAEMGLYLQEQLQKLLKSHACVGEVRNIGLFGAIELVRDRVSREPLAGYNSSSTIMKYLQKELHEAGLFIHVHWNVILIIPPLIITQEQIKEGFEVLDSTLLQIDQLIHNQNM